MNDKTVSQIHYDTACEETLNLLEHLSRESVSDHEALYGVMVTVFKAAIDLAPSGPALTGLIGAALTTASEDVINNQ